MAEYIEREATCRDCFHYDVCDYHITEMTTMTINECPHKFVNKANVVEVVRCKDCKNCEFIYPKKDIGKEAEGAFWCHLFEGSREPNGFCSHGKRMVRNELDQR